MDGLLPHAPAFGAFLVASLLLAIAPGPGVLYIVTRAMVQGRRAGLASVAGVAMGNFCNAVAAILGLALLFAISTMAYSVVRYAGAVYLVVLGFEILVRPHQPDAAVVGHASLSRLVRDGFVVALLNPKTTLFFAAFVPQFVSDRSHAAAQGLILGGLFVGMAAVTDSIYALLAGRLARRLAGTSPARKAGRVLSAGVFIGLGALSALYGQRPAR